MDHKQITLHAFETAYMKELHRWLNDPISIKMVGRAPISYEQTVEHVEHKQKSGDLVLAIKNENQQLVGWVSLSEIQLEHGRASFGILLAPEARGQGYGKLAMKQMIDIGFKQLRLHKIYLTTRGVNEQAIHLYKKVGFQIEGQLREHAYVDGEYVDTYCMGLLASEWN